MGTKANICPFISPASRPQASGKIVTVQGLQGLVVRATWRERGDVSSVVQAELFPSLPRPEGLRNLTSF